MYIDFDRGKKAFRGCQVVQTIAIIVITLYAIIDPTNQKVDLANLAQGM